MKTKPIHFRLTTAPQRKLLFETWEATGSVRIACERAHVSRGLFYYWKPRFEAGGYPALEQVGSHTRKNLPRKDDHIVQQVIALHGAHPDWGKKRVEQELTKANNWVPVVSHNTVKRILRDAWMWSDEKRGVKRPIRERNSAR
jgi:transposase